MNLEEILAEIAHLKDHRWASHDVIIKKIEEFELKVRKAISANVSLGKKDNKVEPKQVEEKERKRRNTSSNEIVYTPGGGIDTPRFERN